MNYFNKKIAITGVTGFLGNAIAVALEGQGARVHALYGDTRDPETFAELDYTYDYLFHFGSPSSQVLFMRKQEFCEQVTVMGFANALDAARAHGIRLIYPSTGLLSSPYHRNEYAKAKAACENMAIDALGWVDTQGIRIFATYGPGEDHKRDYASVPYLFIRDAIDGRRPVVYGDGSQKRDFIFIDDVVQGVLTLADGCSNPIVDLGAGRAHSFSEILYSIGEVLGSTVKADYIDKPGGYVDETLADPTVLQRFYRPTISFKEGIRRTIRYEQSNRLYHDQPADPGIT